LENGEEVSYTKRQILLEVSRCTPGKDRDKMKGKKKVTKNGKELKVLSAFQKNIVVRICNEVMKYNEAHPELKNVSRNTTVAFISEGLRPTYHAEEEAMKKWVQKGEVLEIGKPSTFLEGHKEQVDQYLNQNGITEDEQNKPTMKKAIKHVALNNQQHKRTPSKDICDKTMKRILSNHYKSKSPQKTTKVRVDATNNVRNQGTMAIGLEVGMIERKVPPEFLFNMDAYAIGIQSNQGNGTIIGNREHLGSVKTTKRSLFGGPTLKMFTFMNESSWTIF